MYRADSTHPAGQGWSARLWCGPRVGSAALSTRTPSPSSCRSGSALPWGGGGVVTPNLPSYINCPPGVCACVSPTFGEPTVYPSSQAAHRDNNFPKVILDFFLKESLASIRPLCAWRVCHCVASKNTLANVPCIFFLHDGGCIDLNKRDTPIPAEGCGGWLVGGWWEVRRFFFGGRWCERSHLPDTEKSSHISGTFGLTEHFIRHIVGRGGGTLSPYGGWWGRWSGSREVPLSSGVSKWGGGGGVFSLRPLSGAAQSHEIPSAPSDPPTAPPSFLLRRTGSCGSCTTSTRHLSPSISRRCPPAAVLLPTAFTRQC